MDGPRKFYYDGGKSALVLYCEENPAKRYSSIECALKKFIIDESNRSYVTCIELHNDWSAALTLDNNCYYQASGTMMRWLSDRFTMEQFAAYQSKTGKDLHSMTADPRFADLRRLDFRPAADSPVCRLAEGSFAGALPCANCAAR